MILALWLLSSCARQPERPSAIRLDRQPSSLTALSLPASSRPEPAPAQVPLRGPFTSRPGPGGVRLWQAALPVPLALAGLPGGSGAPAGLTVTGPRGGLRFSRPPQPGTWTIQQGALVLRLPADADPTAGGYTVRHDASTRAERDLSRRDAAAETDRDFALRDATVGDVTRHGVYLPAPASATWALDIPPGARLELTAALLPSFLGDGLSTDGAALEVYADGDRLASVEIDADQPREVSVPVPAGAVSLELRTLPGGDVLLDHVFLAHPTIQVSGRSPRRLVVIFVDTLRADHLSVEGYGRETTPVLDSLAASGVRFRQARSVSPWTLPSAQAALSGRQPEDWSAGPSLAERLSADGWRTIGLVANAYLSPKTGIGRGFDEYYLSQLAGADRQVDDALALLEESAGRDVALMVHFMDPHLPYAEPSAFRGLWEGDAPPGLPDSFTRDRLTRLRPGAVGRDYVIARYDQNVRSVDAALGRLLEAVGDDAAVLVFSDHGEEFWEHGGVEHGHSLHDELVRVPLILRAPGLPAGAVIDAPVSLLDVTPTLLSLLGMEADEGAGVDLLPVIRDEPGAAAALSARPQALGRLLYGRDQWGALLGRTKLIRDGDDIASYDLAADPGEQAPGRGEREQLRALLEEAGLPVVPVWRLGKRARTRSAGRPETLTIQIPGGFAAAWGPYDPNGQLNEPAISADGVVTVAARGRQRRPSEIYLVPRQDSAAGFSVAVDGEALAADVAGGGALWSSGRLRLVEDIAVVPGGEGVPIDPALEAALRELGYLSD